MDCGNQELKAVGENTQEFLFVLIMPENYLGASGSNASRKRRSAPHLSVYLSSRLKM